MEPDAVEIALPVASSCSKTLTSKKVNNAFAELIIFMRFYLDCRLEGKFV